MGQLEGWVNQLTALATTYGVRVLGVLLALFAAWIVAGMVRTSVAKALGRTPLDSTLTKFLANISRYAILLFAVLGCMGVFGIETTSFAAVIGASSLAVGLAFQGSLSNMAAGVMLLLFRPFKVSDYIVVSGEEGTVEEIELFTTTLRTLDNLKIVVPNGTIFGATIKNLTGFEKRRVDIPVGVSYGADMNKTREVLQQAANSVKDGVQDPAPGVFLVGLGGSSVDWQVRVWCKSEEYWTVYEQTVFAAKDALDQAGISIPFPQMDLHFDSPVAEANAARH
jgi:small conductance mechanosensitive channel